MWGGLNEKSLGRGARRHKDDPDDTENDPHDDDLFIAECTPVNLTPTTMNSCLRRRTDLRSFVA